MLFHAGVIERKTAGSSEICGEYQAMPKPSPFRGSSLSRLWVLWLIRECAGSVISEASVRRGPL